MSALDLTNKKFGNLIAVEQVGKDKSRNILWRCRCDCGREIIVKACELKRGHTKSCGCYHKQRASYANITHGGSKTKLYMVWSDMLARCENTRHHAYKWYGEKGVCVCDEWRDFASFREWAIKNGYKIGLTIDRIDGNGNYEPSNCKWATRQEQSDHLSSCVFVDFMGEGLNITQFCKKYDVSQSHFRKVARNNICTKTLMDCIATSKSRITDSERHTLIKGYKEITGEDYKI